MCRRANQRGAGRVVTPREPINPFPPLLVLANIPFHVWSAAHLPSSFPVHCAGRGSPGPCRIRRLLFFFFFFTTLEGVCIAEVPHFYTFHLDLTLEKVLWWPPFSCLWLSLDQLLWPEPPCLSLTPHSCWWCVISGFLSRIVASTSTLCRIAAVFSPADHRREGGQSSWFISGYAAHLPSIVVRIPGPPAGISSSGGRINVHPRAREARQTVGVLSECNLSPGSSTNMQQCIHN